MTWRIAALPRHKGLPVPAMVQFDKHGVPDFRVIDMEKWMTLARTRGCGICGERLGARAWFVGGPGSIEAGTFSDLPMHKDCATYALRVCPFLALPRYRFTMSKVELDGKTIHVNEHASTKRPDRFGLACTSHYGIFVDEQGIGGLRVSRWSEIEWWQHGERIE